MRIILTLLALATATAPALAAPDNGKTPVTIRIAYSDIDLSKAEGRAVLEARINAKIRRACTLDTAARFILNLNMVDEKCATDARAAAFAEVDRVIANQARSGRVLAAS